MSDEQGAQTYKPLTKQQSRDLVYAVRNWLWFQRLCGRDMIFSERYLSQPIAEYLLASHRGLIVPEFDHPGFESSTRPRQVDFALTRKRGEEVQAVIETKWIGSSKYKRRAVIDDLLRLECFRNENKAHVSRYFLVAGMTRNFVSNFRDLDYNEDGSRYKFTEALLEFESTEPLTVEVLNAEQGFRKYFASFRARYKADLPQRFKTTLVEHAYGGKISVYLWKLGSNQNRAIIDYDSEWQ